MFTGFQLDTTSKRLPLGVRIVVTLDGEDEDPFTFAITPLGVHQNFVREIAGPQPVASDVVNVEHTPYSLGHRFIIHLPEDQRIFIGDFPHRVAFEITIERQAISYWLPSNKVLVVIDGHKFDIFQAKEFSPGYQPPVVTTSQPEPREVVVPIPDEASQQESTPDVVVETTQIVVPEPEPEPEPIPEPEPEPEPEPISVKEPKTESINIVDRIRTFIFGTFLPSVKTMWHAKSQIVRWFKRLGKRTIIVIDIVVLLFGLILFTPLAVVHPNQPDSKASGLVITWPLRDAQPGQNIVLSMRDVAGVPYVYEGTVETSSGGTYLLRNGTEYVQAYQNQVMGRVLFTIPWVGKLFGP